MLGTLQPSPAQRDTHAARPAAAIGAVLLAVLVGVAGVRLSRHADPRARCRGGGARAACASRTAPTAAWPCSTRAAASRSSPSSGEAGFLRGALRALARERRNAGPRRGARLRADRPRRRPPDARATRPPAQRIDLESFGPTNAGVFARLLDRASAVGALTRLQEDPMTAAQIDRHPRRSRRARPRKARCSARASTPPTSRRWTASTCRRSAPSGTR